MSRSQSVKESVELRVSQVLRDSEESKEAQKMLKRGSKEVLKRFSRDSKEALMSKSQYSMTIFLNPMSNFQTPMS